MTEESSYGRQANYLAKKYELERKLLELEHTDSRTGKIFADVSIGNEISNLKYQEDFWKKEAMTEARKRFRSLEEIQKERNETR